MELLAERNQEIKKHARKGNELSWWHFEFEELKALEGQMSSAFREMSEQELEIWVTRLKKRELKLHFALIFT